MEMSKTGKECAERMAETSKRMKARLQGKSFIEMFKNMYPDLFKEVK
jgi:hypothetical protein